MKHKIRMIVPYFGKLPEVFPIWLKSCEYNKTIDFLVYTDDKTRYDWPDNVVVRYTTFDKIRKLVQSKFDFEIALNAPYKLCDFKPAYGYIFSEDLVGYDFWGHCDIDLIWGNIRKFVTEELLDKYDKLFTHGHFVLYRNTTEVNNWFRELPQIPDHTWKQVFQSDESWAFDEAGGKSLWGGYAS